MALQVVLVASPVWSAPSAPTILASAPSGIPLFSSAHPPFGAVSALTESNIDIDIDMVSVPIADDSPMTSLEASSVMDTDTNTSMTSEDIDTDVSMEGGDSPFTVDMDIEMLPRAIDDDRDEDEYEVMSAEDASPETI